jgi:predicted enzyme related to lactoylglutathione lyase
MRSNVALNHYQKGHTMKTFMCVLALAATSLLHAAENNEKLPGRTGEFVWNELATTNIQKTKDFYGNMFGWTFVDNKNGEMTYTIIKKNDRDVGGIWVIPSAQQSEIPPHWLAYILVDNLEKSLEKARQNGGTLVKPVQTVKDMGRFAVIKDPSGAHLALWQNLNK